MGDVFIRRTTAALLFVIAALVIICVALLVLVVTPDWKSTSEKPQEIAIPKLEDLRTEPWEKQYRIPVSTIPVHYDLYLHPDLQSGMYSGFVKILVNVTSPMEYLVAHAKDLQISQSTVKSLADDMSYDIKKAFYYKPNQFWVIKLKKSLSPGMYSMHMHFSGNLTGKIVGFYKSVYTTKSGEKRPIATSKFQPTYARQAFPCFDEPSYKSTFTVTLVRPSENYIALSNMPVQTERVNAPVQGFTETVFEKSVPMVTYLACFIVCDFDSVEVMTQHDKKFSVYATKDQIHRTKYAKNIGVHILNYFENYFEVEYPLPKQDMIAIPDFVSGAMEHWGLITYRETNLLYDEASSSSYNKQRVASVISHELAHMWFGNLVTLKWWDDLWLNEGFASYIEYKGVASYETDWDMQSQFLISDLHSVMDLDAQLTSHPIVQVVNHPDEITEIFDKISYSKGASVLRLLENFMGDENFRVGVRNFLTKYKYDNAVTQDLWRELNKVSSPDLHISDIMDTWTRQMGYPVLSVKKSPSDKNKLIIRQERFLADPEARSQDDSPYGYKWDVPISYFTDASPAENTWLYRNMDQVEIRKPGGAAWIKINKGQTGFYRVNYDLDLWNDLIGVLNTNPQELSAADRANLINDAFRLARADKLSYNVVFNMANYLSKEQHFIPWRTVTSELAEFTHLLRKTKVFPYLRKYIIGLVRNHIDRLGWDDVGTVLVRRNRIDLLTLACSCGDEDCLQEAYRRFKSWIVDPTVVIAPNLRSLVYHYGIKKAGYDEWEILLQRYLTELNAQEKLKMMSGLTAIEQDWIIYRFLELAKNETIIRPQDYFFALIYTGRNPTATNIVWGYIKENWNYLVDRFTINDRYLGRTVKAVGTEFTQEHELRDLKQFFKDNPEAGAGKRAREQALEELQNNIKWIKKHEDTLYKLLL